MAEGANSGIGEIRRLLGFYSSEADTLPSPEPRLDLPLDGEMACQSITKQSGFAGWI
jgi:hypothetical protein